MRKIKPKKVRRVNESIEGKGFVWYKEKSVALYVPENVSEICIFRGKEMFTIIIPEVLPATLVIEE